MNKPAPDMRQHILDVARSLMTCKGYTAVGLAEVVAAAGVPKGSFYYYFRSKEEFGQALLQEYFTDYLRTVDEKLSAPGSAAERLLGYFRYWADTQGTDLPDEKCLVVKLGPEVCDLSENMRGVLKEGTDAIVARIAACVEAGREDGSLPCSTRAQPLAESLYAMWLGASLLVKLRHSTAPFHTAYDATTELLT